MVSGWRPGHSGCVCCGGASARRSAGSWRAVRAYHMARNSSGECVARCEVRKECESKCWCLVYLRLVLVVQTASCRRMSKLCGGMQPSQSKCLAMDGERQPQRWTDANILPSVFLPLLPTTQISPPPPCHALKHLTLPPRHSPRAYRTADHSNNTTRSTGSPPPSLCPPPDVLPPPKQQPYSSLLDILF
jgi:hypothetical protein